MGDIRVPQCGELIDYARAYNRSCSGEQSRWGEKFAERQTADVE